MQVTKLKQNFENLKFDILKFDIQTGIFKKTNNFLGWFTRILIVMSQTLFFDWEPQKWLAEI
jgi:hypothetical protein